MNIASVPVPVFIFWILFTLIMCYEILMFLRGKSSKDWKPYPAIIEKLGIQVRQDDFGKDESKSFVKYEYTINKTTYKGSKVIYGDIWTSNYDDSCEDIIGLKVGSKVTVFVNPKNFNMSVLKQGYRGNFYWLVGVPFIAVLLILIFQ